MRNATLLRHEHHSFSMDWHYTRNWRCPNHALLLTPLPYEFCIPSWHAGRYHTSSLHVTSVWIGSHRERRWSVYAGEASFGMLAPRGARPRVNGALVDTN